VAAAAVLTLAGGVVTAGVLTTHASADAGPVAGAQSFSLPNVKAGGPAVALGAVPGRATIVDFFAAWCDPCRAELPLVEAVSKRAGAPAVVGIDVLDQRTDALTLLKQTGVTFPAAFDHDGATSQKWGIVGLPVTVFVAPDGRIVSYRRGQLDAHTLDGLVARLERASR
jgi:cytochrome c biogenesis protein CcmG/thiol:disulfide interchange protein DsbE